MSGPSPIGHISDTARWVAVYRAMETERADAIFRDPYARRLAGARGEEIVGRMKRGRAMAWPMIVRTAVMDELITRCVVQGTDAVINLAAGLDARPWRLSLPAMVRWTDVDFPDVLEYKRTMLAEERPSCRYEQAAADLADAAARQAVLERATAGAREVLVLTEGLLIYLEPGQVADLARDLHARTPIRWWVMDIASPGLVKMLARTWGRQLAAGNAPFRFAPAEGTAFFAPHGWREAEFRSTWVEANRLGRTPPLAWLWNLLARLQSAAQQEEGRRFAGIVLLERG